MEKLKTLKGISIGDSVKICSTGRLSNSAISKIYGIENNFFVVKMECGRKRRFSSMNGYEDGISGSYYIKPV